MSPIHILWVNLVTDTFPALALGVEPPEEDIMDRQPRDQKIPFLTSRQWINIFTIGVVGAALTLSAYFIGARITPETGVTMAFITLGLIQLFAALGFQSERSSIFRIKPKEHKYLWLAFFGSAALQVVIVLVPFLREIFGLTVLTVSEWIFILALCFIMLLFIEFRKAVYRYLHKRKEAEQDSAN
ncbi:cation transporting ATPase C-terminal domain-containing protein [Methanimicrococcus sp. OttesenSCG-928-J09]|nr:cation transporting ATPase C-terminal domain-containing protein [Methanimicrococcus sp. OttesenSCG-928-J09]